MINYPKLKWPEGKKFAFTVFDDTDRATLNNVSEIYQLIKGLGFRTTKSVWVLKEKAERNPVCPSPTLDNQKYLNWILSLQKAGFEIGLHNTSANSSYRNETINGIKNFRKLLRQEPKVLANHSGNRDGIYWASDRLNGIYKKIYQLLTKQKDKNKYLGHIPDSEYFWGDICQKHVKYVRNFVYPDINTLKQCPVMPYHDPDKPFVNYWFSSSEGAAVESFNKCISEENQDRLEAEGGACIMYTHFGARFYQNGKINPRFKFLMERLSKKNGWFVPVSTLLDFLLSQKENSIITKQERGKLERKWLYHKIIQGKRS